MKIRIEISLSFIVSQILEIFLMNFLLFLWWFCFPFTFSRSLFETTQTLFWAVFGLVDLDSFELEGIKIFTRFWGMLMFGTYSVINIVVLLNLLIAMMNHSYQLISVSFNLRQINNNSFRNTPKQCETKTENEND